MTVKKGLNGPRRRSSLLDKTITERTSFTWKRSPRNTNTHRSLLKLRSLPPSSRTFPGPPIAGTLQRHTDHTIQLLRSTVTDPEIPGPRSGSGGFHRPGGIRRCPPSPRRPEPWRDDRERRRIPPSGPETPATGSRSGISGGLSGAPRCSGHCGWNPAGGGQIAGDRPVSGDDRANPLGPGRAYRGGGVTRARRQARPLCKHPTGRRTRVPPPPRRCPIRIPRWP
jgi:hypothetical protein